MNSGNTSGRGKTPVSGYDDSKMRFRPHEIDSLFHAKCRDLNIKALPPQMERFKQLMFISCNNNVFSLIENHLGPHSAGIINGILRNRDRKTYVTALNLDGNQLGDSGAAKLVPALRDRGSVLSHVSLRSNDIGAVGGSKIFDAIAESRTIVALDLGGISGINRNHIGHAGSVALSACLSTNKSIVKLGLSSNGIGPDGAAELAKGIAANHTLESVDISSNNLELAGVSALASALARSTIKTVNLSNNQLADAAVTTLCIDVLTHNPSLQTIDLSANAILDPGAAVLAEVLKLPPADEVQAMRRIEEHTNRHAEAQRARIEGDLPADVQETLFSGHTSEHQMSIDGTPITPAAAMYDSEPMTPVTPLPQKKLGDAGMCAVVSINLTGNKIGSVGCTSIFEALEVNSTLQHLKLGRNGIYGDAAPAIAAALRVNGTLQTLDLSNNTLGDEGAAAVGEGLRSSPALRVVDLSANHIGDDGAISLTEGVRASNSLSALTLTNNTIGDDGGLALCDAAAQSPTLITLATGLNRMNYKTTVQLNDAMKGRVAEFKRGMVDRVRGQIEKLQDAEQALTDAEHQLTSAKASRETDEATFKSSVKTMATIRDDFARVIQGLEADIDTAMGAKDAAGKELQAVTGDLGQLKAYSASKLRMIQSKAQRDSETHRVVIKKLKVQKTIVKDAKLRADVEEGDLQRRLDVQNGQYNIDKSRLQRKRDELSKVKSQLGME